MGLRRRSIRLRIFLLVVIPILSLIGVYAFAATITASNAINLSNSRSAYNTINLPTGLLQAAIDTERIDAVVYLADPTPLNQASLRAQERKTDRSVAALRAAAVRAAGSATAPVKQAFTTMIASVGRLPALRSRVASRDISRPQAISGYGALINQDITLETQLVLAGADVRSAGLGLALNRTGNVVSLLLQEESLLLGDTLARTFSAADRQHFAELVGARRAMYAELFSDLDPPLRAIYDTYLGPKVTGPLQALEDRVINDPRAGRVPPVSPVAWSAAVQAVSRGYASASERASAVLTARAQPEANSTFLRLFLVGGVGLVAVILSIFMSIWIGRGLVRQLSELRRSALELATKRLPAVVERLRAGQDVDVTAEAPPLETSGDEIGQVTQAFNSVQRTAVEAAVDEARLRRGVSDVFRNLARRSQSLLHRQLALLDTMERRAREPEELDDLFRIDHLSTRMRRHSEGLIILSGDSPGRGWRHPVRLVDVLRAAVAEVEDYTRIRVTTGSQAALIGPAVADVIHLIAELAENATIFSPPNTPVRVHGDIVGRGFAVEIEDRGLGIAEEKLATINRDLENPPQFDLSGSEQLGLFVAGQLARRHDIKIALQPSVFGGITAIVLIPKALIVDDAEAAAAVMASERAIRLTGRHGPAGRGVIAESVPMAQLSVSSSAAELLSGPAGAAEDSSSGAFSDGPPDRPGGSEHADPRVASELTAMGLPVRVRQASLAPQLRDGGTPATGPAEKEADVPSPEVARSRVTALQRGWERGRYVSGAPVPTFEGTQNSGPGEEPGEDGDEQPTDE